MKLARWTYSCKTVPDFTRTVVTTAEASDDVAWSKFVARNLPGVGSNPLVKDDWAVHREEFTDKR